jgi:hypothetical protein
MDDISALSFGDKTLGKIDENHILHFNWNLHLLINAYACMLPNTTESLLPRN